MLTFPLNFAITFYLSYILHLNEKCEIQNSSLIFLNNTSQTSTFCNVWIQDLLFSGFAILF